MCHNTTSHSRSGAITAAPDSKHQHWRGTQGILCLEGAPVLVSVARELLFTAVRAELVEAHKKLTH